MEGFRGDFPMHRIRGAECLGPNILCRIDACEHAEGRQTDQQGGPSHDFAGWSPGLEEMVKQMSEMLLLLLLITVQRLFTELLLLKL